MLPTSQCLISNSSTKTNTIIEPAYANYLSFQIWIEIWTFLRFTKF